MPCRIAALVTALLMAWAAGCAHRTPGAPEREKTASSLTTADQSDLSSPSGPSKGTGVKKKMPVNAFGRVAELFVEKKPQATIYALTVLDRPACTRQLEGRVRQLDRQMKEIVGRSQQPKDQIQPSPKNELLQILIRREALDAAMALTNKTGKGISLPVSQQTLVRLLKKN